MSGPPLANVTRSDAGTVSALPVAVAAPMIDAFGQPAGPRRSSVAFEQVAKRPRFHTSPRPTRMSIPVTIGGSRSGAVVSLAVAEIARPRGCGGRPRPARRGDGVRLDPGGRLVLGERRDDDGGDGARRGHGGEGLRGSGLHGAESAPRRRRATTGRAP